MEQKNMKSAVINSVLGGVKNKLYLTDALGVLKKVKN